MGSLFALVAYCFVVYGLTVYSGRWGNPSAYDLQWYVWTYYGGLLIAMGVVAEIHGFRRKSIARVGARGLSGVRPLVWALGTFFLPALVLPLYAYERPRMRRAFPPVA